MVCPIGVIGGVGSVNASPIREGVVRRAGVKIIGPAPCGHARVYDHLAVPGYIGGDIPVARLAVILPTASHVHQIELTLWPPSSNHV